MFSVKELFVKQFFLPWILNTLCNVHILVLSLLRVLSIIGWPVVQLLGRSVSPTVGLFVHLSYSLEGQKISVSSGMGRGVRQSDGQPAGWSVGWFARLTGGEFRWLVNQSVGRPSGSVGLLQRWARF